MMDPAERLLWMIFERTEEWEEVTKVPRHNGNTVKSAPRPQTGKDKVNPHTPKPPKLADGKK